MWGAIISLAGNWLAGQGGGGGGGGGMYAPPSNLSNGGNTADFSNWTVATSGSKASATQPLTPTTAAVFCLGGLVLWRILGKKKG